MSVDAVPADVTPPVRPLPYEVTYDKNWRDLIEPNGVFDKDSMDQMRRELHDYTVVMDLYTKVLLHISDGNLSKPTTRADVACDHADEFYEVQWRLKLADEIDAAASGAATTSRDFGRGFTEAARLIRRRAEEMLSGD